MDASAGASIGRPDPTEPAAMPSPTLNTVLSFGLAVLAALSLPVFAADPEPGALGCDPDGLPEGWRVLADGAQPLPMPQPSALKRDVLQLIDCLADPDPLLRDAVAYTSLAAWMRAESGLDPTVLEAARQRLLEMLVRADAQGFAQPFAALVLAEVTRTDRIAPWMDAEQRTQMVAASARYLHGVRDYRGFIEGEGWRHGVAHGADWVLQLALNPAIDTDQLAQLREAIGAQMLAADGHAYVFNEPARLATPLLFIARRGVFDAADWEAWLLQLPPRIGPAAAVWGSAEALAARHNLLALLLVLHFEASRSEDPGIQALLPGVLAALRAMP
jgi:hypothetical protein